MANKQGFALEKIDERFRKSALNYSIICIAFVLLLAVLTAILSAESGLDFDLNMFETVAIDPVVIIQEHDIASGNEDITVGVSGYKVENEKIHVEIFGENK